MKKLVMLASILLLPFVSLSAQRPTNLPDTGPSGKPADYGVPRRADVGGGPRPHEAGTTTVIIGTAGTEQKGPHMVDGEHKFVMEYAADKIARALGKTLVAPVITYVPEGSWENPGGHMAKPGTITLPEDRFVELLVNAGRSLRAGGFKRSCSSASRAAIARGCGRPRNGSTRCGRAPRRRAGLTTTTPSHTPTKTST